MSARTTDTAAAIAEFAVGLQADEIPRAALAAAKRSILDGLSVAVAGSRSHTAEASRRALLAGAGQGPAQVLGTGFRSSPSTAAQLNGIAAHALDFDDVWADDDGVVAWRGHPTVCVLPAVIAAAESAAGTGADVLAGYVIGVEIAGKLGTAFGPGLGRAGWHPTAVLGTVAAAAAAARVLGLGRHQVQIALGIAATQASGLHRNFGTDTKPFHAGHAARCGIDAALLAGSGFTANPAAIDDYLRVHGGSAERAADLALGLGADYDLVTPGLSIKKYPCCRFAHLPLDALFGLLADGAPHPEDVRSITVRIERGADDALNCPEARTGLEGRFSMPYLLAAAVLDGQVTLASFSDHAVKRPRVRRLMGLVHTEYRDRCGAEVELITRSGSSAGIAEIVRGDPANPMSYEEELEKCRSCLEPVLGPGQVAALAAAIDGLAELPSASDLTRILAEPVAAR